MLAQQFNCSLVLRCRRQYRPTNDLDDAILAFLRSQLPRLFHALLVPETVLREGLEGLRTGIAGGGELGEDLAGLAQGDAGPMLEDLCDGAVLGGEGSGIVLDDFGVGVSVEVCCYGEKLCVRVAGVSLERKRGRCREARVYLLRRRKDP
jgi:hypothetical protein